MVDKGTAAASELVVQSDRDREAAESCEYAFSDARECARAVPLEGEKVSAGPEDRFDPLADRREAYTLTGFVLASGAADRVTGLVHFGGELAAGVAVVAEQRFAAVAAAALEQPDADLALVELTRFAAFGFESSAVPAPRPTPTRTQGLTQAIAPVARLKLTGRSGYALPSKTATNTATAVESLI